MTRFAVAFAAAAMLLAPSLTATPAAADPAMNLAQVDVRVGPSGVSVGTRAHRNRHMHRDRHMHRHNHRHNARGHARCTTRVIIRDGRRTTVRSCR